MGENKKIGNKFYFLPCVGTLFASKNQLGGSCWFLLSGRGDA